MPDNRIEEAYRLYQSGKSLKDIDTEFHIVNRNIKSIIKEYATKWHVFDFTKSIYNMILTKVNSGGGK